MAVGGSGQRLAEKNSKSCTSSPSSGRARRHASPLTEGLGARATGAHEVAGYGLTIPSRPAVTRQGICVFFSPGLFSPASSTQVPVHGAPRRLGLRQHAWGGGCGRGSPASARRRGARAGRALARQHYTQGRMLQRLAALQQRGRRFM